MEKILENVKEDEVTIDECLNERAMYVRDKLAYLKSLKEHIVAHKRAEKQMKQINEEIALREVQVRKNLISDSTLALKSLLQDIDCRRPSELCP